MEIQRASFCWFLEEGLAEGITFPNNRLYNNLELHLLGDNYKLKYQNIASTNVKDEMQLIRYKYMSQQDLSTRKLEQLKNKKFL